MTLCATFEAAHVRHLAQNNMRRRFLARPLFERLHVREAEWRARGEAAIKEEMERRINAWLLSDRHLY